MSGLRWIGRFGWPEATRARPAGRFDQDTKLRRPGILRFIENDAVLLDANARRGFDIREQLERERDLVGVHERPIREAVSAIVALQLRCDTKRCAAQPGAEWPERLLPQCDKVTGPGSAEREREELRAVTPRAIPRAQILLRAR